MSHVAISTPPNPANVAAIKALPNGGIGATAVHGRAHSRAARRQMIRQLEGAGLSHRVAMSLGWSTSMPPVEPVVNSTLQAIEDDAAAVDGVASADTVEDQPVEE